MIRQDMKVSHIFSLIEKRIEPLDLAYLQNELLIDSNHLPWSLFHEICFARKLKCIGVTFCFSQFRVELQWRGNHRHTNTDTHSTLLSTVSECTGSPFRPE